MPDKNTIEKLNQHVLQMKKDIVELVYAAPPGHLGGSLSCAEILCALYLHKMRYDPKNPCWDQRDIFIMSKGHGSLAQYAAFIQLEMIDRREIAYAKQIGAVFQCHPDASKTPGVEVNTGSLGQGLSMAVGMALGIRLDGSDRRVYCLIGDGETDEGQIWEAMNAAKVHKLDNLVAILDDNKLNVSGKKSEVYDTGNLSAKAAAFGWYVLDIDGHDFTQIIYALDFADTVKGMPVMIVAHTKKANGISFAENIAAFHNCTLTEEQYQSALADISREG